MPWLNRRIHSIARISHLCYKPLDRVSSVLGGLDTSIRESNHVLAKHTSLGILGLTLLEASLALLILHPILVTIWLGGKVFNYRIVSSSLGGSSTS